MNRPAVRVRSDSSGTAGGTGAVMYDMSRPLIGGRVGELGDHTPLNFDDLANTTLGAVLKIWDATLGGGPCVRPQTSEHWDSRTTRESSEATAGEFTTILIPVSHGHLPEAPHPEGTSEPGYWREPASVARCLVSVGPSLTFGSHRRVLWAAVADWRADPRAGGPDIAEASTRDDRVEGGEALGSPAEQRTHRASAVEVVEQLQDLLQLPAESVLRAAGVNRRTYHHWKQTGALPRLASQARLWDLALTVQIWQDVLGDDLAAWVRHPDRIGLLETGAFNDLTDQVMARQLQRLDPSERRYRDRSSAGYFESEASDPEGASAQTVPRPVQRARRVRRAGQPRRTSS